MEKLKVIKCEKVEEPLKASYNAFGYPEYRHLKDIKVIRNVKEYASVDTIPQSEQLFNEIFTINPKTLLPDGDIAIFMSENTSPEIL